MESGSSDTLPPVENPFPEESIEARLYGVIADTPSQITASELAARADCEPQTAHEYLESFVSLGVVHEHRGTPPTYERNDAYFEWDTVKTLAQDHSLDELESHLEALLERIQTYQERYDAETPSGANHEFGDASEADLADWDAARAELQRYDRARQICLGRTDATESGSDQNG